MCLTPSIPQDNSGQQAQQAEQQRQNNITAAQGGIDSAFSGFNDDYFNNYQKSYTNAYDPLVDQQYNDARKSVSLALARTGNLNSSYGADELDFALNSGQGIVQPASEKRHVRSPLPGDAQPVKSLA